MKKFIGFLLFIILAALVSIAICFNKQNYIPITVKYTIPIVKEVVQKVKDDKSDLIKRYTSMNGTRICQKCGNIIADPPMFIGYLGLNMRRYNQLLNELKSHKILCKCN